MSLQTEIIQFLLAGITVGSIYALIALGFVTIYNVTGIINFAQGEFAVYGAFIAITAFQKSRLLSGNWQVALEWPLPAAALVGVVITTLVGILLYRLAIQPARRASILSMIIITIGAAFVMRGAALLLWGTDPYRLPVFTPGPPLKIFGAILTRQSVWVIAVTAVLLVILYWFFNRTLTGKTLQACAEVPGVYLHAIGGAASLIAQTVKRVLGVYKLEFGVPEAMWVIEVEDFPVVVTMDAHGNSLHAEVAQRSKAVLDELLAKA